MPTYEYKCNVCGYSFDLFQSINDEPVTECPLCTGRVERLIGVGGGLIFKGSGFYITDYRSESYKKEQKAETTSSSSSDTSSKTGKEPVSKVSTEK